MQHMVDGMRPLDDRDVFQMSQFLDVQRYRDPLLPCLNLNLHQENMSNRDSNDGNAISMTSDGAAVSSSKPIPPLSKERSNVVAMPLL